MSTGLSDESVAPATPLPGAEFGRSPVRAPHCEVEVLDGTGRLGAEGVARIRSAAEMAAGLLGLAGECRVRFVRDDEMARMHEQYLGIGGTTDVLTFNLSEQPERLDADLLVCVDEAERACAGASIPVEHEMMLYIVHGLMHCAGFDDGDPKSARAMHEREDSLLTALGVGPVFQRVAAGRRL